MRIADDCLSFFGLLILPMMIGKIVLRAIITGESIEALNGWASQAKKTGSLRMRSNVRVYAIMLFATNQTIPRNSR